MSVNIAPSPRQQFFDVNGDPLTGGKLFTYLAGTTTKANTYTSSTGGTANSNPIVLDSNGRSPYGIWLTAGTDYKFVLAPSTDSDPPVAAIFTEDNVSGVNDIPTDASSSEWVSDTTLTPTYISATSFSFSGDQRSVYSVNRRIKATVTAGTVYGQILTSTYAAPTNTITVILDSGSLDSGLSAVDVGLLSLTFPSLPLDQSVPLGNGYVSWTISGNALTASIKTLSGNDPSTSDPVYCVFRDYSQTTAPLLTKSITSALSMTLSSGSRAGTFDGIPSRLRCVAIWTGTAVVLGIYNALSSSFLRFKPLNETALHTTTAEGGAGGADTDRIIYTNSVQTDKIIMELGYMESTQTTAGTWASAPTKQVTVGANYNKSGDIVGFYHYQSSVSGLTGTTTIPLDDTIPQTTEGFEATGTYPIVFSPSSSANLIVVKAMVPMASSVSTGTLIATISTDASANCLATGAVRAATANALYQVPVYWAMIAGTTADINFQVRAGCSAAGTTTINGASGAGLFSGTLDTIVEIQEFFA